LIIDKTDFQWNAEYGKVKAFIKKNRRLPSAHCADEEEKYLGKWRLYHVEKYKKGLVPEWQAKKIAALGLDNKIFEIVWNEKFEATREIITSVIQSGKLSGKGGIRHILGDDLFSWWQVQRRKYREGWLEEDKAKLLRENNLLYKFGDLLDRIKQSKGS
jgi:hypothetical protein